MAKYSIKFNDEDFNNYLEHHGIKGQKWGVRRSLEELGYKVNQRRKRRRHDRILKDPRLLAKHINEFSQEEIDKRVKELKNAELVRKSANLPVKLKGKKARWAKDPNKLEKHRNDLTDEEFEEAMKRLNDDQKIHEAKMKQMSRLNDYVAKGADFIKSISGIATNTENIRSKIEKWQNLDKEKAEAELDRQLKLEKDRLLIESSKKTIEGKEIDNRNAILKGYTDYKAAKDKIVRDQLDFQRDQANKQQKHDQDIDLNAKKYKSETKRKNAESKATVAEINARTDKIKSETRRTREYKVRSGNKKSTSAKIVKGLPAISSKSFMNFSVKQLIKNNKPVTTEDIAGYLPDRSESPWMETRIEDLMKVRHSDLFSEDILRMQVDDNFLQHHGIKGG